MGFWYFLKFASAQIKLMDLRHLDVGDHKAELAEWAGGGGGGGEQGGLQNTSAGYKQYPEH